MGEGRARGRGGREIGETAKLGVGEGRGRGVVEGRCVVGKIGVVVGVGQEANV